MRGDTRRVFLSTTAAGSVGRPATGLGFPRHKRPDKAQRFPTPQWFPTSYGGTTHVLGPAADVVHLVYVPGPYPAPAYQGDRKPEDEGDGKPEDGGDEAAAISLVPWPRPVRSPELRDD